MEWPWDSHKRPRLQDKVALIQLASERKVGLFHIALHEGNTPDELIAPALKEIIESSSIIKAGVGVLNADFKRLKTDFNLEPKGAFELSHLHSLVTCPQQATTKLHALSTQVEQHLGLPLWKGNVRTSDWSRPLNPSQTQYAVTDAYAGFMLFHCMNAKRLAMDPIPPLPRLAETYLPFAMPKHLTIQLESVTEDGEIRIITTEEFFGVTKNIKEFCKVSEGKDDVENVDTDSDPRKLDVVEGEHLVGEGTKHSTEASQKADKRPISKHDGLQPSQRQSSTKARKSRADKKPADNSGLRTSMDSSCWALYGQLASHRKGIAVSQGISAFIIASNKVLQALALRRPSNEQELFLVPGVGKGKVAQYGVAWLEIIVHFEAEEKQRKDHEPKQEASDEKEGDDPPNPKLQDRDPKRRRIVRVGRSKEILIPSGKPLPSLSTGLSFQLGETNIADEPSLPSRPEDQNDATDNSDGDSIFGPPMELPLPAVLKRKRDIALQSGPDGQQTPPQSVTQTPALISVPISTVKIEPTTEPVFIPSSDPKPLAEPVPVPASTPTILTPTPPSTATQPLSKVPLDRLDFERSILRKKLEAYGKSVVWAMHPKPSEPLLSEASIQCLIATLPRTIEEFRRVPGIQRLIQACETVNKDVWQTFEKWTQGSGPVSSAGSTR
ncbi:hypothetical protein HD806DRAFT_509634 [Xylariaceae sp. AK1471]|nr:hypothetical protein HD806DRAFT_509634 [Xylariaceae sp. AK1471]